MNQKLVSIVQSINNHLHLIKISVWSRFTLQIIKSFYISTLWVIKHLKSLDNFAKDSFSNTKIDELMIRDYDFITVYSYKKSQNLVKLIVISIILSRNKKKRRMEPVAEHMSISLPQRGSRKKKIFKKKVGGCCNGPFLVVE